MLLPINTINLTEELLHQCRTLHGDKYHYTEVIPSGKHHRILVYTCSICNSINRQLLHNHLNGNGCRNCGYQHKAKRNRYTFDDIVTIGKELHGDAYEYLGIIESTTKASNRKIKYRCTICDTVNEQSIYRFIHGTSCRRCSRVRGAATARSKKQTTTFALVKRLGTKIYKRKYRYLKLEKINRNQPLITFFCKECDLEITQNVETHLLRDGCPECIKRIRKKISASSERSILGALKQIHKEYEFINVVAVKNKPHIVFKCPSCSMIRTQDAAAMTQGRKCRCSVKSISDLRSLIK